MKCSYKFETVEIFRQAKLSQVLDMIFSLVLLSGFLPHTHFWTLHKCIGKKPVWSYFSEPLLLFAWKKLTHFIQGKKVFSLVSLYWFAVTFITIESAFSRGMLSSEIKTCIFFILTISFSKKASFLKTIFLSENEDATAGFFFFNECICITIWLKPGQKISPNILPAVKISEDYDLFEVIRDQTWDNLLPKSQAPALYTQKSSCYVKLQPRAGIWLCSCSICSPEPPQKAEEREAKSTLWSSDVIYQRVCIDYICIAFTWSEQCN